MRRTLTALACTLVPAAGGARLTFPQAPSKADLRGPTQRVFSLAEYDLLRFWRDRSMPTPDARTGHAAS